jgi:hypothetical protein
MSAAGKRSHLFPARFSLSPRGIPALPTDLTFAVKKRSFAWPSELKFPPTTPSEPSRRMCMTIGIVWARRTCGFQRVLRAKSHHHVGLRADQFSRGGARSKKWAVGIGSEEPDTRDLSVLLRARGNRTGSIALRSPVGHTASIRTPCRAAGGRAHPN